ncbi:uncharacterized protein LOC109703796 [Ananas comosus]|uniref:Uncharacterized protein LOC109703796 n=1 Tax=Ananas comosus TaxID=4615 RepID=A0A6P5EA93_ANACO|nr:uncharacterized protein LOC109703796 [Ananas comosus]XP_020080101.1 uncharacterized protein LOC109703796 [Ananas comosus]XP_020080102.1 uncharacterized protein LOC109703796 [Ananas comosus]
MRFLHGAPPPTCPVDRRCLQWAQIYLKYCVCGAKDEIALLLGLVSVVSWGIAEVPQIITNYKTKSTEGLSVAFLMTWIIGDLFNLVGCLLEPATLPTQFYMALLYTATTVVLTGQTIYYSHIYPRLKANKSRASSKEEENSATEKLLAYKDDHKSKASDQANGDSSGIEGNHMRSSPIPVDPTVIQRYTSDGRDFYYMSARSLSSSPIPIAGSWLPHSPYTSRTPLLTQTRFLSREPLLDGLVPTQSAPPTSNTRNILSVVPFTAFCLVMYFNYFSIGNTFNTSPHGTVLRLGRKLLQVKRGDSSLQHSGENSGIGSFLGWAMAAIYMGGRLPQIFLNIRRGNVEGLNPLMFTFALIGNATYVGSILVNSLDWNKIRPNLPWLVDAGGCVLLDSLIILQFVYFHLRTRKNHEDADTD